MFNESDDFMLDCVAGEWTDIRGLEDDIYLFPRTMDWTFVTTHEMSIGLGPYFAHRPISHETRAATYQSHATEPAVRSVALAILFDGEPYR